MKKYNLQPWHSAKPLEEKIKEAGYEFFQMIPEDKLMEAVNAIFQTGLNVMLQHLRDGDGVIWVDQYRFQQM